MSYKVVEITKDYVIFEDNYFPVCLYYDNEVLHFDKKVSLGDDVYHLVIHIDVRNKNFYYFISKVVKDDEVLPDFNLRVYAGEFIKYKLGFDIFDSVFSSISDIVDSIGDIQSSVGSLEGDIASLSGEIDGIKGSISGVNNSISGCCDSIESKLESINCNIDLSSVEDKIVEISKKVDVLNVMDITNMIDEKLGQLFSLNSLNGSNGSKYKDGEMVKVKGYDGEWKVEGSYPLLNNDSVTIIIYKLVQDDKVLLAPSPFLGE